MIRIHRHKFHAIQTEVNGIKFPSKKEAKYYQELLLRQKAKDIVFFLYQVPFHLPGGVKYFCDFQVFHTNGTISFIDTKGFKTPTYKAKKKMVEALYPILIEEA